MTTWVWKVPGQRSLQQVRVSAADIVATLSAATTAWGWVGGVDGIKTVLSSNLSLRNKTDLSKIGVNLKLHPSSYNVLTSSGIKVLTDTDANNSFKGTAITQLIGQTVCALAHRLDEYRAVRLFMDHLADYLLSGAKDGIAEALYAQLTDKISVIVNEGATRGLPDHFDAAIQRLDLPLNPSNFSGELTNDMAEIGYVVDPLR